MRTLAGEGIIAAMNPSSSPLSLVEAHGQPCVSLRLPAGDRALVALHGAHLLSWQTADGAERLYLSPKAVFDGQAAIRGGVPVCFPQFAGRGPLPKHGFARNRPWQQAQAKQSAGEARAVLRLRDDEATRALWPHAFVARLDLRLRAGELEMILTIDNPGDGGFSFTAALHGYLHVAAIADARLHGLDGSAYHDSVDGSSKTQPPSALTIEGEVDRIYPRPAGRLRLVQRDGSLRIAQSRSFTDTVVWNPGAKLCATMADMPAGGHRQMLCVEAGRITEPALLAPGRRWRGWQRLTVEDPAA